MGVVQGRMMRRREELIRQYYSSSSIIQEQVIWKARENYCISMERLKVMKNDYELFNSCPHGCWNRKKSTNQDSALIETAATDYGQILLSVVCDGMGGLEKVRSPAPCWQRHFPDGFIRNFRDCCIAVWRSMP